MKMSCYLEMRSLTGRYKLLPQIATEEHYSTVGTAQHCADILEQKSMYDILRKTNLWPHMTSEVHVFVFNSESCWRLAPSQKHQRWLQFLAPSEPLHICHDRHHGTAQEYKLRNFAHHRDDWPVQKTHTGCLRNKNNNTACRGSGSGKSETTVRYF